MTIATTAPSGNVGRHLVHDLVRAGVRPRVLAHRETSLDPVLRNHVDLHLIDQRDPTPVAGSSAETVNGARDGR